MSIWTDLGGTRLVVEHVEAGGVDTRRVVAGEGPPLVLLHGFAGHLELFARVVGPLARTFEVHAIDLIGHGYSAKPEIEYGIPAYVDHVRAYCDTYTDGRVSVIGQSLGGWIAARIAIAEPDRLERLVLSSPGGTHANAESMDGLATTTLAAICSDDPEDTRRRLRFVLLDDADVTEELVEVRHSIYRQADLRAVVDRLVALQRPEFRTAHLLAAEELESITTPTLVVWTAGLASSTAHPPGGQDRWPLEEGRFWHRHIPDSQFALIAPCGHAPAWERPAQFIDAVLPFLQGVREEEGLWSSTS